jgi:hypothetical protein
MPHIVKNIVGLSKLKNLKKKFLLLITCLILLIVIFSFNSTSGRFVLQSSNKLTGLILSLILLFLVFASIRVIKVEEEGKYLPPGIHIEIPESTENSLYKKDIEKGIDKIKRFLKQLSVYNIYERRVREVEEESFNYISLGEVGYGPKAVTIRFTMKGFAEELYEYFPYRPFGIAIGNKIVISIKNILDKLDRSNYDVSQIIERIVKHELWHVAGGKDDPNSKGIANPYLSYDINKYEKEIMKRRILEIISE